MAYILHKTITRKSGLHSGQLEDRYFSNDGTWTKNEQKALIFNSQLCALDCRAHMTEENIKPIKVKICL